MDNGKYLELLDEFSELIDQPDNQIYREGERKLDYVELMVQSVINTDAVEIPKGQLHRIVYVNDELSNMLKNVRHTQLQDLKHLLENSGYVTSITQLLGEIFFTIKALTFDITFIID